jgi:hypothetical protein
VRFKLNCDPRRSGRVERHGNRLTNNGSIKADPLFKRREEQLYTREKIGRTGQKELYRLNDVNTMPHWLQALIPGMRLTNSARICSRDHEDSHSGCRTNPSLPQMRLTAEVPLEQMVREGKTG